VGANSRGQEVYRYGDVLAEVLIHVRERHKLDINDFQSNAVCLPQTAFDLMPIDGTGMHMTLIHRRVFEKIDPPWFVMNPERSGEDFYFCKKVQKAGIKMVCDLSIHTGHAVGEDVDFGIKELLSYCKHVSQVQSDSSRFDIEAAMGDTLIQVGKWTG
jgi:hypothetical protein